MSKLYKSAEVMKDVKAYFKEHLPMYSILSVRRKSLRPDDAYLYIVSAKKDDGTYTVWTFWNQDIKLLTFGHYGLTNKKDCKKLMDEFNYDDSKYTSKLKTKIQNALNWIKKKI